MLSAIVCVMCIKLPVELRSTMVKGKRMLLAYGKEMLHILRRFEQFQLGSSNNFILNGVLGVPVGETNVF